MNGIIAGLGPAGACKEELRFSVSLYATNVYLTEYKRGQKTFVNLVCPLRGYLGPEIAKKTHLKNQRPVVGSLSSFLIGQNRRFLHGCPRWSNIYKKI